MNSTSPENDDFQSRFELRTVLETSRMLIESRESDFVLQNLLFIVMGKLLTSRAAILLHNPAEGDYTLRTARGLRSAQEGDRVPVTLGRDEKNLSHIAWADFPEKLPELDPAMDQGVFVPLRTSNHHLGFLFLGGKATREPYSRRELEFSESLCIISSAAIANSQLFTELKETNRKLDRRVHELNTLFDLSKEFNLLADRDKITQIFKFALLGQLFVRTFFMIYKTPAGLVLLASNGLDSVPDQDEMDALFHEIPADLHIPGPKMYQDHPFLEKSGIACLAGVSVQDEKTAIIGVGKRLNQDPFTETDQNFLFSLASLAVVSVQKTFFLEERIDKERMEEELSIAKSIQKGLMPSPIPEIDGIDLAARTISSREVGGDYFDVAHTPDKNTIIAIGDVTGKGVPAALLMANLQSMLHVLLPVEITLSDATERINNLIFRNTPSDKFITFFWGKYFAEEKRLRYVNAGHNPPLLLRSGKSEFEELTTGGLLLGAMEIMTPYQHEDIRLQQGDVLVCYTDGVNEATDPAMQHEYGEERLQQVILKHSEKPSEEILNEIVSDVQKFTTGKFQDDLTLIIIKVT